MCSAEKGLPETHRRLRARKEGPETGDDPQNGDGVGDGARPCGRLPESGPRQGAGEAAAGDKTEIVPPTAEHILAVHGLLHSHHRLPLLVLDATGMRLSELEGLTWGDIDEPHGRWRVAQSVSKTGQARWVNVAPIVFQTVLDLVPRDDRTAARRVFQGFGGDRFRTAITRACVAAGAPAFSPHDLRHRRISLLHAGGVPWARIGEHVGQRNLAVTANTYSHVLADGTEIDYATTL